MRAMILAAGLGTRLRPLTELRAKPALPVRGRPVISLLLELLARQGFREVMINLHHLPESIRTAVEADHPSGIDIAWSLESELLGTGGALRQAVDFLRGTPHCLVLAGDMLLDVDLRAFADRHVESGRPVTLLLRADARGEAFGTIGVDAQGEVVRIGRDQLPGKRGTRAEAAQGLFTGVRCFSREVLGHWPEQAVFEDLRDWLLPGTESRDEPIGAEIVSESESVWEPVGTPAEYLRVNLTPPDLPRLGGPVSEWTGDVSLAGTDFDVVAARTARIADDAKLTRCVIWDGEELPGGFAATDGVYAGGAFHACPNLRAGGVQ